MLDELPAKLEKAGRLGAVLSPHLTVEEAYLLVKFVRRIDPEAILAVGPVVVSGEDELAHLATGINDMSAQIKSMLDSKAGLLLAISHELRSPLTRMRVNLELLGKSDTQRSLIDDIREIEHLLSSILESEKLNTAHASLNRTSCDLAQVIESDYQLVVTRALNTLRFEKNGAHPELFSELLSQHNAVIDSITASKATLEDVYINKTGKQFE